MPTCFQSIEIQTSFKPIKGHGIRLIIFICIIDISKLNKEPEYVYVFKRKKRQFIRDIINNVINTMTAMNTNNEI